MSDQDRVHGGVGVVRVGDLDVTLTPLTMTEERALRRQLRAAAESAATDYFSRCAKLLKAMQAQPAAYLKAVETITTLTATGPKVSDAEYDEYRESPAGVALELFARGKKATPGLTREGLAACVTAANADEVLDQMFAVIAGGDDPKSTP